MKTSKPKRKSKVCWLIPRWVCSAKDRCYLPRNQSAHASGPNKVWRLAVSDVGVVDLPSELLDLCGYWQGDELRLCLGFIPGKGTATNAEGNAIVIYIVPHGLKSKKRDEAARRDLLAIRHARKTGRPEEYWQGKALKPISRPGDKRSQYLDWKHGSGAGQPRDRLSKFRKQIKRKASK